MAQPTDTETKKPARARRKPAEPETEATEPEAPARKAMTSAHKDALALGREQGRAVRTYLEALDSHKPKRGRKRTPDSITQRLAAIEDRLSDADPLNRLHLVQERLDLQTELATMVNGSNIDMPALEQAFITAAKEYGERKGISYYAWREAGVDAAVLRQAGIARSA